MILRRTHEAFVQALEELASSLDGNVSGESPGEGAFWAQLMRSSAAQARGLRAIDPENRTLAAMAHRDEQMAKNLVWLVRERFAGRKIVVWSATFHSVRNIRDISTRVEYLNYSEAVSMGHRVWEALADEGYYNLGVTAYEGAAAPWHMRMPTGLDRPLLARPLGYREMLADWTRTMNGILFLRAMERSTPAVDPGAR